MESQVCEAIKLLDILEKNSSEHLLQENYTKLRNLLDDENSSISKSKAEEMGSLIDCLACSSVSPDLFRKLKTTIDTIVHSNISTSQLTMLFDDIEAIKEQLESSQKLYEKVTNLLDVGGNIEKNCDTFLKISLEIKSFNQIIRGQQGILMQLIKVLRPKMLNQVRKRRLFPIQDSYLISLTDIKYDENIIGVGLTSVVYLAFHPHFGEVAMKRLKKDCPIAPNAQEAYFHREARCLQKLKHPNILQFFGLIWQPDFHALIVEYMINDNLQNFLKKFRLNTYIKAKLLCDVAQGVSYLHLLPKRIIHNDLKAANVLISQDIVAKVGDFSLADWTPYTTELYNENQEKLCGATMTHQSPERWLNINYVTTKSDVYSFGIMMWEVYSGKVPFAKEKADFIKSAVITGQRPDKQRLKNMPIVLKELMERCWHQEEHERPDMEMVLNEILQLFSEEHIKNTVATAKSNLLKELRLHQIDRIVNSTFGNSFQPAILFAQPEEVPSSNNLYLSNNTSGAFLERANFDKQNSSTTFPYNDQVFDDESDENNVEKMIDPAGHENLDIGYEVYEYSVFVSFAEEDRDWVETVLQPKITSPYCQLYLYTEQFRVGEPIVNSIQHALEITEKTMLVLSRNFIKSNWCLFEARMAFHKCMDKGFDKMIPILLEPIPEKDMPRDLKTYLTGYIYLEWPSNKAIFRRREFWEKLKKVLQPHDNLAQRKNLNLQNCKLMWLVSHIFRNGNKRFVFSVKDLGGILANLS